MIHLLARYKISSSLRGGPPLTGFWRALVDRTPGLRDFERSARALDRQLHQQARAATTVLPRNLHSSVLDAVRQARASRSAPGKSRLSGRLVPRLGWALPVGAALMAAAVIWWIQSPDPITTADADPLPGTQIVAAETVVIPVMPTAGALWAELRLLHVAVELDPLGREWAALAEDARGAFQFLLASLP